MVEFLSLYLIATIRRWSGSQMPIPLLSMQKYYIYVYMRAFEPYMTRSALV